MFENYPKKRIKLPKKLQEIYEFHYKTNREGNTAASNLAQKMEKWLHEKVASDVEKSHNKKTLEIGAGTLNQLKYEQPNSYDIVEPFTKLYIESQHLQKVKNIYSDIDEINLLQKYERIISIATFEHIIDLPKVVAKSCLLLKHSGVLRTGIPNEGTFLWKLGWKLTTGLEFKLKYGMDYGILMRYEHVNTANEIEEILNYFYFINKCQTFGLNKSIALYRFYESSKPKVELAESYLKSLVEKN